MKPRHLVAVVVGLGLGVVALVVARGEPDGSLAGASIATSILFIGVGWALVTCGVVAWSRRPSSRFGVLLVAAGVAWSLVELGNPAVGSSLLFTIGLVGYAAGPALVAHAALAYPGGAVAGRPARAFVVLAYVSTVLVLGLLAALAFDPVATGCLECPRNLLQLTSSSALVTALTRGGLVAGLVWAPALALIAAARIARASTATRLLTAPVLLSLVVYLVLVAVDYAHGIGRGFVSNDGLDRGLWIAQGAALAALTVGVAAGWARSRRARTSLARLVIELSEATVPGQLRDALASALGDAALEIAYPLLSDQQVDAHGRAIELSGAADRVTTPLMRGGRPVAFIRHRTELRYDPELIADVVAAAALALDHERLQAQARWQLEQLRASRTRTVETGDAERRRLERDLHDGAQQRLVVLSFALTLLRAELAGHDAEPLAAAELQLRSALEELRELATGIYPAVLIDEGLASAITMLAETAAVPVEIVALPEDRLQPVVEAAAYFLVAAVIRGATSTPVSVSVGHAHGRLLVELGGDDSPDEVLVELEDRIGAVDGELAVVRTAAGPTIIRAEVPCAS